MSRWFIRTKRGKALGKDKVPDDLADLEVVSYGKRHQRVYDLLDDSNEYLSDLFMFTFYCYPLIIDSGLLCTHMGRETLCTHMGRES